MRASKVIFGKSGILKSCGKKLAKSRSREGSQVSNEDVCLDDWEKSYNFFIRNELYNLNQLPGDHEPP